MPARSSRMPRGIYEVSFSEFLMEPEEVLKKARDRQMPVIIEEVGVAVQRIRVQELADAEGFFGTPTISIDSVTRHDVEEFKKEVDRKKAAFVMKGDAFLGWACIISFAALEVIKSNNPRWASKWAWDRTIMWGPG